MAVRLPNEIAEYYSGNLKEEIEGLYRKREVFEEINEISFLYGIREEALIKNVRFLLDSGKLFVKDGRLKWNPKAMTPEYFSLDDKVDSMKVSEREKDRIKKMVADNLDKMGRSDDLGNGAGV